MIEIDEFTKKFTSEKISDTVKIGRNFFQVSDELLDMKNKIKVQPFAIGTYLGSGKPFHPSIAMLDWMDKRTEKYVVIDKKSAWLFLCGRDVFSNSIVKQNSDKGQVLVKNEFGEVLGLGEFTGKRVAIKNLLDRGDFLRRERH